MLIKYDFSLAPSLILDCSYIIKYDNTLEHRHTEFCTICVNEKRI